MLVVRKICIVGVFVLGFLVNLCAQDPQFTQFYSAPLYLNPALAGSTKLTKATLLYRNQWPSIPANFVTYSASIDQSLPRFSSGLGLSIIKDQLGDVFDATTLAGSYSFYFNVTRKLEIRMGITAGYTINKLNGDIEFIDEPNSSGLNLATNETQFSSAQKNYLDLGSGIEIHNSIYSVGFSAYHLNRPDNSFFTSVNRVPIRFNLHGGARLSLKESKIYRPLYRLLYNVVKKDVYINPEFLFKKQGDFTQLDLGIDVHYGIFMFGVWNRGIPLRKRSNTLGRDAIALLAGYSQHGFSLAYSYDVTISNQTAAGTGGAHEISMVYLFDLRIDRKKPLRRHQIISCPQF